MVYGYLCLVARGRPEVQSGTGFQTDTLLGYQADEAGDHLHAIKRRRKGSASMSVYRLGVAPVVLA